MMISQKRLKKLANREYREAFLREMVTEWVVQQIKVLRKSRGWSQARLAKEAGEKPQSAIARAESESYGNWNTNTLFELANAFGVAIQIRFVSWPDFLESTEDTSPHAMSVASFSTADFAPPMPYKEVYGDQLKPPCFQASPSESQSIYRSYRDEKFTNNLCSPVIL